MNRLSTITPIYFFLFFFFFVQIKLSGQTIIDYTLGNKNPPIEIEHILYCPGEEIRFNNTNTSQHSWKYTWSTSPVDPTLICVNSAFDPLDCHNPKANPVTTTVYEVSACEPGKEEIVKKAKITVKVVNFIVHPKADDFATNKEGRIMISTFLGGGYHTSEFTTINNETAQNEDGKVKITVHITPPDFGKGKTVYFRVKDPDPDDLSEYETDSNGGDNYDPNLPTLNGISGTTVSTTAEIHTINGVDVAAAEVELKITNRFSGDNYVVEASLDPDFQDICKKDETVTMVAWKRAYVEYDRMYKKGATLIANFTLDGDDLNNDELFVDNVADFEVGDKIYILTPTSSGASVIVEGKDASVNKLTVTDMPYNLAAYQTGFKINGEDELYSVSSPLTELAFGGNSNGDDGGVFVEFNWLPTGTSSTPKYTIFPYPDPSDPSDPYRLYCAYWFHQRAIGNCGSSFGACKNAIYLLAAADMGPNPSGFVPGGITISTDNTSSLFLDSLNPDRIEEAVVHEFGHQIGLGNGNNGHIDLYVATPNHEGNDNCLMSYENDFTNFIAEFDFETDGCIHDVRKLPDPF